MSVDCINSSHKLSACSKKTGWLWNMNTSSLSKFYVAGNLLAAASVVSILHIMPYSVLLLQAAFFMILRRTGSLIKGENVPHHFPHLCYTTELLLLPPVELFKGLIRQVLSDKYQPACYRFLDQCAYLSQYLIAAWLLAQFRMLALFTSTFAVCRLPRSRWGVGTMMLNLTAALGCGAAFLPVRLASVAQTLTSPAYTAAHFLGSTACLANEYQTPSGISNLERANVSSKKEI